MGGRGVSSPGLCWTGMGGAMLVFTMRQKLKGIGYF